MIVQNKKQEILNSISIELKENISDALKAGMLKSHINRFFADKVNNYSGQTEDDINPLLALSDLLLGNKTKCTIYYYPDDTDTVIEFQNGKSKISKKSKEQVNVESNLSRLIIKALSSGEVSKDELLKLYNKTISPNKSALNYRGRNAAIQRRRFQKTRG